MAHLHLQERGKLGRVYLLGLASLLEKMELALIQPCQQIPWWQSEVWLAEQCVPQSQSAPQPHRLPRLQGQVKLEMERR